MEGEELKKTKNKKGFRKVEEEKDKTTWKREGEEVAEGEG